MKRRIWILVLAAGVVLVGCGASSKDTSSQNNPASTSAEGGTSTDGTAPETSEPADTKPDVVEPAALDASPYVLTFGDLSAVALPAGDPGEVSIIWSDDTVNRRGSVTMIVRNNTTDDIGRIDVTGTARDEAGDLVGSGSSQGFNPAVVAPGEIAYGYVYFDTELSDQSFEFAFEVDAEPVRADAFMSALPVTVTEINDTGAELVGAATNELDEEVNGPIGAAVLCFDAGGAVIDYTDGFLEQDDLAAGATGSFSINLFDRPCPNGLVSASGYSS